MQNVGGEIRLGDKMEHSNLFFRLTEHQILISLQNEH
jgi:hypothetical protein